MNAAGAPDSARAGLLHEAMPYRDGREFVSGVLSYVRAALAAGQPVLVEVPGPRLDLVREALGAEAVGVRFGDMARDGRNPGRIIPGVLRMFADAHPGRRVAMVGECIWPGRSEHEYAAGVEHDALINLAFAGQDADILCPYDIAGLPPRALADAERTHPFIREVSGRRASRRFTDPRAVVDTIFDRQPAPPPDAEVFEFSLVAHARQLVSAWASEAGLPADRVTDLVIAISELGGNSVAHAGEGAALLRWIDDGWLICEVRDRGHITDPLAGRLHPHESMESGRGLLMVNHLCDLVQVRTGPSGTAIRLWMNIHADPNSGRPQTDH